MNGGKNNVANPDSFTVESDPIIFAKPTYDGNTFGGWFYDAGFTSPATGIATGSTTGNKTLYAKWTPIVYTIEYLSGNEVSATIVADKKPWGANWTLKGMEYAFQREGYVHNGWSLTKDGPIAYAFGATYSEDKDLILYPHWTSTANCPYLLYDFGAIQVYENCDGTKTAEIDGSSMKDVPAIENVDVDFVELDRTFPVGVPATVVLPFTIDTANVHGGQFYTVSLKKNESGLWVAHGDTVRTPQLTANTPYMVIVKAEDGQLTFDGPVKLNTSVENNTVTNNEDGSTWTFTATYKYHKWNEEETKDGNLYGFAAQNVSGAKVGEYVQLSSGAWIRPMRAYLEYKPKAETVPSVDLPSNPRPVMRSIDEVLPGTIDFVIDENSVEVFTTTLTRKNYSVESKNAPNQWFDMRGRLLNTKPTTKGIYYYNGKRIIVK